MAMKITDTQMSSDVTRHTATEWPAPADATGASIWSVTWLPGRALTRDQAITGMTIAEAVVEHADDLADNGSRWWLHIDGWAAELGVTGPHAVAEASPSPEDHADMPAVITLAFDAQPGRRGYLQSTDPATGMARVRIDGQTVTMLAAHLQYAGDEPQTADEGDDAVSAELSGRPGRGTLRADLEAAVRIWREESKPYPDEGAADSARRGGFGYCANELAQILAAHAGPRLAPELAARRTAARAVLGDYQNGAGTADPNELSLCAARLADALSHVLAVLDDGDQAAEQFPAAAAQLAEIRLVLEAFDWETDSRQYALEQIESIVTGGDE